MPSIRILALAVLQIFCSQCCSFIVKKGHTSRTTRLSEEKIRVGLFFMYMPHIKFQEFCSQGCSYTKSLCPKRGNKSTENLWNRFKKLISSSTPRSVTICQILGSWPKRFFRYFVHKVVPIQNACVRKRGVTQPKIYRISSKVNQFIYTLVCNYMPNIRILAKAVLQIFCSKCCSYTKCLCPKKGNNSTENLRNMFKS